MKVWANQIIRDHRQQEEIQEYEKLKYSELYYNQMTLQCLTAKKIKQLYDMDALIKTKIIPPRVLEIILRH